MNKPNDLPLELDDLPPLTMRQQKMLNHFLQYGEATEAYRQSGYGGKYPNRSAFNLINRNPLKAHIEYYKKKTSEVLDATWIADRLKAIVLKNEFENGDTAIKALSELNKMQGNYAPEKTQNVNMEADWIDVRNARLSYKMDK